MESGTRGRRPSRRLAVGFTAVYLALVGAGLSALAAEPEIHWIDNYRAAISEAKATGKPLFLEFRCVP
mgnify:FL=1|jgi:hypothetical protein